MTVRRRLRRIKRLAILAAVVGAVIAVRREVARRNAVPRVGGPAEWPPLQPAEEPVAAVGDLVDDRSVIRNVPDPADAGGQDWILPVEGACPATHPVKVNTGSGIFHVPGGRFYERTNPQRCYVDAAAAEADGYRAAKGS